MTARPAVLVTDGDQRAALAVVRSLGAAGYPVYVCAPRRRSLAGASRYARAEALVTEPLEDPQRFAADIRALVARWNIGVLIPIGDAALLAALPDRARLPNVMVPFPDERVVRRIADKAAVLHAAATIGIAIPRQASASDQAALTAMAPMLEYPVVLKPSRSVTEHGGRRLKLLVRHVASAAELAVAAAELDPAAFPVLVQQRIVGPGIGIFLLVWHGVTLATFAHRRIREKPPAGGVSVYRESVAADPELVRRSRALLDLFGWCGVAMVEYKIDERTGTPYLMEINGRFWGSLQLAIDAGVDFPALLVSAALGKPLAPQPAYTAGVRSRWFWGDVDHLLARLRRSRVALSLPPGTPGRWAAIRDFFTVDRRADREEILRRDDPRPFFRETAQWLSSLR
ncbi:MAG TPA: ATP-grasp domain-containing protein [Gemmatimonadaceae bacterium]|nr:ATP-grasp domain-containing protein [Gemmatimonadaceae bacterium]